MRKISSALLAARYMFHSTYRLHTAAPLQDVSKLRNQAVFLMGAGGSGKGYVAYDWLKYMPGGGSGGVSRDVYNHPTHGLSEQERNLSNLNFEKVKQRLESKGIKIELVDASKARIPFKLYTYDSEGGQQYLDPTDWASELPPNIYKEVEGLKDVIFTTPVHELPSYWRQVNPDVYKEELAGYQATAPGYVHEMSSDMAKAYFEAALETGDPLFVDGTGTNLGKMAAQMQQAKEKGYRVSLVFVYVPLTVNQIRNATRARNVNPMIVAQQWSLIAKNYNKLKSVADKAKVVINRNDPHDIKSFKNNEDKINAFIQKGSDGRYADLYELIQDKAPQELGEWGKILRPR